MFGCTFDGLFYWGSWFSDALFFGAGACITYFIVRNAKPKKVNTDRIDSFEILKARLARGDISLEEFNTLKSVL